MKPSSNTLVLFLAFLAFFLVLFFNFADVQASFENCTEIQNLKWAELKAAETSYARFDKTLELIGVEKTPELEEIRDANIKFARDNFSPENCKRFYFPFLNGTEEIPPPQPLVPTTTTTTGTTP